MDDSSTSNSTDPKAGTGGAADGPIGGEAEGLPPIAPMTSTLFRQWFGVPFLIVAAIVGSAVTVVLLFGEPVSPQQRSLDELLQPLMASSGEKSMGMLLTREKGLWQKALELSVRLQNKDKEEGLTDVQLRSIADRLTTMIRADLKVADTVGPASVSPEKQKAIRSRRLEFLIHALGRTELPQVIDPLIDVLRTGREPYTTVAMQELGGLHELPGSRRAVAPIVALLGETERPETLLMGCTVLSVLADPGDADVIAALKRARLRFEGEVAWSASLALARLGSDVGKSTLMDLLDRSFLESGERYIVTTEDGSVRRFALPPGRVEELLMAAITASANLEDAEVWERIEALSSDAAPNVRGRANAVLKART